MLANDVAEERTRHSGEMVHAMAESRKQKLEGRRGKADGRKQKAEKKRTPCGQLTADKSESKNAKKMERRGTENAEKKAQDQRNRRRKTTGPEGLPIGCGNPVTIGRGAVLRRR